MVLKNSKYILAIILAIAIIPLVLAEDFNTCRTFESSGYYTVNETIDATAGGPAGSECFGIGATDVLIDCQNNIIDGAKSGFMIGIVTGNNLTNVTIKNCNFINAVNSWDSTIYNGNVHLENILFNNNPNDAKLYIFNSTDSNLINVNLSSYELDLHLDHYWSSKSITDRSMCTMKITNSYELNNPIYYYNDSGETHDSTGKFILCNANNYNITNITGTLVSWATDNASISYSNITTLDLQNSSHINVTQTNISSTINILNIVGLNFNHINSIGSSADIYMSENLSFYDWNITGPNPDLDYDIDFTDSNRTVFNHSIFKKSPWPLAMYYVVDITIDDLIIKDCDVGINYADLYGNVTMINSRIENCSTGIEASTDFASLGTNLFYNNFFNNTVNYAPNSNYISDWNTTIMNGRRVIGPGVSIAGNYWADPSGTGFSQTCTDTNVDGICDNPYDIMNDAQCTQDVDCSNQTDYLPLSNKDYIIISGCVNITNPGVYKLNESVTDYAGYSCINITTNNIILDCQGNIMDGIADMFGITAHNTNNITIQNCVIHDFDWGYYSVNNSNVTMKNINITDVAYGVYIEALDGLLINNLSITNNTLLIGDVLGSEPVKNVIIANSTIDCLTDSNDGFDITPPAGLGSNVTINNVNVTNCSINPVLLYNIDDLLVDGMVVDYSVSDAYWFEGCSNVMAKNISLICNLPYEWDTYGFYIASNTNLTITNSSVKGCNYSFDYQSGEINAYNNFFNTTYYPSLAADNFNNWNATKTEGSRIIDYGLSFGGNYWALTNGSGYSQTCSDTTADGFCDAPFDIYNQDDCTQGIDCGNNTDYLPLSNNANWIMLSRDQGRTGWDTNPYSIIYGLNHANYTMPGIGTSTTGASPVIVNGFLYIGASSGTIYKLNATYINQQIANYTTGGGIYSTPAVVNGHVYVGSTDGQVYMLRADDLSSEANYTTGGAIYSSPAVNDGYVYVGSDDGKVYMLSDYDLSLVNTFDSGNATNYIRSSPTIYGGYVYVGSNSGQVYQLNSTNMSLVNNFTASGSISYSSPIIWGDGDAYLYITADDASTIPWGGNVYQLNRTNLELIASFHSDRNFVGSVTASGEYIYTPADTGCGTLGRYSTIYKLYLGDISSATNSITVGGCPRTGTFSVKNDKGYFQTQSTLREYDVSGSNFDAIATYTYSGTGCGSTYFASPAITDNYAYAVDNCGRVFQTNSTDVSLTNDNTILISNYSTTGVSHGKTPNASEDILFKITCADHLPDHYAWPITAYINVYNGTVFNESTIFTSIVETVNSDEEYVYNLTTDYTNNKENWTGEYWCGNGMSNSSHYNDSVMLNEIPVINNLVLTDNGSAIIATCSATDDDNDSLTYYYQFTNVNDSLVRKDWVIGNAYHYFSEDSLDIINATCIVSDGITYSDTISDVIQAPENSNPLIIDFYEPPTPIDGSHNNSQVNISIDCGSGPATYYLWYGYGGDNYTWLDNTTDSSYMASVGDEGPYQYWGACCVEGICSENSSVREWTYDVNPPVLNSDPLFLNQDGNLTWYYEIVGNAGLYNYSFRVCDSNGDCLFNETNLLGGTTYYVFESEVNVSSWVDGTYSINLSVSSGYNAFNQSNLVQIGYNVSDCGLIIRDGSYEIVNNITCSNGNCFRNYECFGVAEDVTRVSFDGNGFVINGSYYDGPELYYADGIDYSTNTCDNGGFPCVINVSGMVMVDVDGGIKFFGTNNSIIRDNIMTYMGEDGLSSDYTLNTAIINNSITYNNPLISSYAIYLYAINTSIINNTISSNSYDLLLPLLDDTDICVVDFGDGEVYLPNIVSGNIYNVTYTRYYEAMNYSCLLFNGTQGNYYGVNNGTGYSDTCAIEENGFCSPYYYDIDNDLWTNNLGELSNFAADYLPLSNQNSELSFTTINLIRPQNLNITNDDTPLIVFNISVINISGPAKAAECFVSIDGNNQGIVEDVINWTNTNITSSQLDEGSHAVSVNCSDDSGNEASSNINTIEVDITPPMINARSLFIRDLIPIFDVNYSDTLSPDAACVVTALNRGRKTVINWSNTEIGVDNTRYEGNVTCIDRAGNTASDDIILITDTTLPIVGIISPVSNAWVNDNTTDITFIVTDSSSVNTSCLVSINGTSYGHNYYVDNNSETTITTNELSNDVNYSLKVNCTDEGGSIGRSDSQRISIDATIPRIVKSATLNISEAYANTSIGCNFSFADTLSDIMNINYSWFVNNSLIINYDGLITSNNSEYQANGFNGYFKRNDNVSCNATGTDRAGNTIITQSQITITDSAPLAVNVSISPSPATTADDLVCDYTYVDLDFDPQADVYYQWVVDGITNDANGSILGRGNFSGNSFIICSVTLFDGLINSSITDSPGINLSDVIAPNITNVTMEVTSGYNSAVYDIFANCADTSSGLMNNYPKISFKDPNGTIQGNFTMTKVYGNQYKYSYAFSTIGLYQDFYVYCRDAQNNLAVTGGNMTFLSINGTTLITNYGGGTKEVRTVSIQNVTLASFCGDGVCDKDENPFRCAQDCRVDFETALTCLWKDPKSCLYTKSWFATLLLLFIIVSTLYFVYRVESNKEPRWMQKWF